MSAIEGVQHCKLCGEEATVPGHPELIFSIVEKNGTTPVGFLCAPCWEQLTPKNPDRKTRRAINANNAIVAGPTIEKTGPYLCPPPSKKFTFLPDGSIARNPDGKFIRKTP